MTPTGRVLEMQAVDAGYGKKQVLHGVSIGVDRSDIVGLVGENGAGKSTALKVLGGELHQWRGHVFHDGKDISEMPAFLRARQGIGFLKPGGQVFPSMTVAENIRLSMAVGKGTDTLSKRFDDTCNWFPELKDKMNRYAGVLSAGERRLLALSVVVVQRPCVLLLDEPTEGLAPEIGHRLLTRITEYIREVNGCALVVEQNTSFILECCSVIHFMSRGGIRATFQSSEPQLKVKLEDLYFAER